MSRVVWVKFESKIIVISAPSGAGKTTLCESLLKNCTQLMRCVTTTTRAKRTNEVNGRDYHFISTQEYDALLKKNEFVEHADVHGHKYGITKAEIERIFGQNKHCLLIIDVQGAQTIRKKYDNAFSIFIQPPSLQELEQRLRKRGQDKEETIIQRLKNAREEMKSARHYDVVIVNDQFDRALDELVECVNQVTRKKNARGAVNGNGA